MSGGEGLENMKLPDTNSLSYSPVPAQRSFPFDTVGLFGPDGASSDVLQNDNGLGLSAVLTACGQGKPAWPLLSNLTCLRGFYVEKSGILSCKIITAARVSRFHFISAVYFLFSS